MAQFVGYWVWRRKRLRQNRAFMARPEESILGKPTPISLHELGAVWAEKDIRSPASVARPVWPLVKAERLR